MFTQLTRWHPQCSGDSILSLQLWLESSKKEEQWFVQAVIIHSSTSNLAYQFTAGGHNSGDIHCVEVESGRVTTLLLAPPTPSSTITSGHSRPNSVISSAATLTGQLLEQDCKHLDCPLHSTPPAHTYTGMLIHILTTLSSYFFLQHMR